MPKDDLKVLSPVNVEHNTYFDGKAHETIRHYVCTKCGAKWQHIKESGVGGHGSTWSLE
jgi:hypothetical protein